MIALLTAFAVIGSTSAGPSGGGGGGGGGNGGGGGGGGGDSTSTGCPATTVTCSSEHSIKVKGGKNPVYETVTAGEVCTTLTGTCNDNGGIGLSVDEQCAVTGSISCDTLVGNVFNCDTLTDYLGDVPCQDSWFGGTTAKHSIQAKPEGGGGGGGGGGKGGGGGGGEEPSEPVTCTEGTIDCGSCVTVTEKVKGQTVTVEHCAGQYCQDVLSGTCSGSLYLNADCTVTVTDPLACTATLFGVSGNVFSCAVDDVLDFLPEGSCDPSWFA